MTQDVHPRTDRAGRGRSAAVPRRMLEGLNDEDLLARSRAGADDSPQRAVAREVLVRRYGPLVRACARHYRDSPEPLEDLIQVGYVGLLKAVNHYDPAVGSGLRAYALPCITGEIKRHFRDKRWQVHVTRPVQELLLEMRGAIEDLTHELGRQPADDELAGRLGVATQELREARQAAEGFSALSLDAPAGGGDATIELGDLLGTEDPAVDQAVGMAAVAQHWDELPAREQRILLLRYYGNRTQEEIAGQLGISQMHVSRLQARALARLRDRLAEDTPSRSRPAHRKTA
ncbi:MAG TPA: SigB/SigF/SigG family RNA polymerase sigma factor [Trebonia sp.]|nr:SigB/SigF/SigG family RNA polymerase sigma factor [Trebonia sp.]